MRMQYAGSTSVMVPTRARRRTRLTRRGRLVLLVVLTTLVLAAFSLGRVTSSVASAPVATHAVVVRPGETLWDFALRVAPNADPRVTVIKLEALNHLPSPALDAGEVLRVPVVG
jgi:hypothetical protein